MISLKPPQEQLTLIGHQSQWAQFFSAYDNQAMPPSWIFYGPEGIGKATFAYCAAKKILSAEALKTNGLPEPMVLNQIAKGSYPNCYTLLPEGDHKKEITIEKVRDFIGYLQKKAPLPGWRVIIIDSADFLNRFASNALLKILEEPPERTLIILIAHQMNKLLPTLRSRCQKLLFFPLSYEELETEDRVKKKIFGLSQGDLKMYHYLISEEGQNFIKSFRFLIDQSLEGNTFKLYPFCQKIIETPNNCFYVFKILPSWLYFYAMSDYLGKRTQILKAWQEIIYFLQESEQTHLDQAHRLFSILLLLERNKTLL